MSGRTDQLTSIAVFFCVFLHAGPPYSAIKHLLSSNDDEMAFMGNGYPSGTKLLWDDLEFLFL